VSDEHEAAQTRGMTDWRLRINQHETFDHDSIDSLAHDWDRIGDPATPPRWPLKFYVPRSTEDVVAAVEECRRLGQRLIVRSKGHSSNDLVTPVGGAVLLTEELVGVLDVDADAMTATAWAGTPSAAVDEQLAQHGLGLPVIGDHAHITIGGFASVGGITASSFRHGMFVDVVEGLEYVDWDGRVHQLTRTDDLDQLHRVLMGLGRHGVITRMTLRIVRARKYEEYWENDAERYDSMDDFIEASGRLSADPPEDATFLRGMWLDFPLPGDRDLVMGTISVYRPVEASLAERAVDAAAHGVLHRLGAIAGRLPEAVDRVVKMVGMAGVVFAPRYATIKNAEFFTEKTLDATVGDPQRFMVVISPMDRYEEHFRRVWSLLERYREETGCFTFLTLYFKSIWSEYLSGGDPGNRRWVELLCYVGIDPERMTPELLDRIATEFDDLCIEGGAYRYMHTRTGHDPSRMARIDPNAVHNGGVSVHPYDRPLEG
jgi:FAD/FMN-containing dehydrogenase